MQELEAYRLYSNHRFAQLGKPSQVEQTEINADRESNDWIYLPCSTVRPCFFSERPILECLQPILESVHAKIVAKYISHSIEVVFENGGQMK